MARAANEDPRAIANPDDPESQVREYIKLVQTIEALESRKSELRTSIFDYMEEEAYEDNKGNLQLELPMPIDGVVRLEKQKRVSRKLDELAAETIIEQNNLTDAVYKMVRVIDEDALMAAHYEGQLTEDEIDQMFPATVVWALRTPKK